jgi:ABC-type uncharacterized transport system substrate-binding protein
LAVACACCLSAQDPAADRPLILLGKSYPQYQQVASAFGEEWKTATGGEPIVISFPTLEARKKQLLTSRPKIVVGVGEIPTMWALGREEEFRLAFTMVVAPERLEGFAKLLSTKNRVLTGVSIEIAPEKQLELLLAIMPNLKRIGVLTHTAALRENVSKLTGLCETKGLQTIHVEVSALAELPAKLSELLAHVDLVWSLPDPAVFQSELAQHIIAQCAERRVPLLGLSATFVKSGATISFDPDYAEVGQLLAKQCLVASDKQSTSLTIVSTQTIVVSINERSFRALNLTAELDSPRVRIIRF